MFKIRAQIPNNQRRQKNAQIIFLLRRRGRSSRLPFRRDEPDPRDEPVLCGEHGAQLTQRDLQHPQDRAGGAGLPQPQRPRQRQRQEEQRAG